MCDTSSIPTGRAPARGSSIRKRTSLHLHLLSDATDVISTSRRKLGSMDSVFQLWDLISLIQESNVEYQMKTLFFSTHRTLRTPNVWGFFPHQPILQLSRHQLCVLPFNYDTSVNVDPQVKGSVPQEFSTPLQTPIVSPGLLNLRLNKCGVPMTPSSRSLIC